MSAACRNNICHCNKRELLIHRVSSWAPCSLGSPNLSLLHRKTHLSLNQQSASLSAAALSRASPAEPQLRRIKRLFTLRSKNLSDCVSALPAKWADLQLWSFHTRPAKSPGAEVPTSGSAPHCGHGAPSLCKALRHSTAPPPLGTSPREVFWSYGISLTFPIHSCSLKAPRLM